MYGVKNEGIYPKESSRRVVKKCFMEEGGTDLGPKGWVVLKQEGNIPVRRDIGSSVDHSVWHMCAP